MRKRKRKRGTRREGGRKGSRRVKGGRCKGVNEAMMLHLTSQPNLTPYTRNTDQTSQSPHLTLSTKTPAVTHLPTGPLITVSLSSISSK